MYQRGAKNGGVILNIGMIGLGNMGGAVARNLQRAGFHVVAHDLRKEAAAALIAHGATWAATPSIFAGHYDPSFRLALCLKDLSLIDELLTQTGTRSELTQAAYARFREAAARYGDDAGEMSVCRVIEDDAGVALRVAGDWVAPWEVKHPGDSAASQR